MTWKAALLIFVAATLGFTALDHFLLPRRIFVTDLEGNALLAGSITLFAFALGPLLWRLMLRFYKRL